MAEGRHGACEVLFMKVVVRLETSPAASRVELFLEVPFMMNYVSKDVREHDTSLLLVSGPKLLLVSLVLFGSPQCHLPTSDNREQQGCCYKLVRLADRWRAEIHSPAQLQLITVSAPNDKNSNR